MGIENFVLVGAHVRLEPLGRRHIAGLLAAAAIDPSLYRWTPVPQDEAHAAAYVDTALASRDAGAAAPFAIIRSDDNTVVGSTRLWNLERWSWPATHARHGHGWIDACEIGHTWLSGPAIRSAINTETKLLMLTHAFEKWNALRVCFHTDARNQRSAAALERIGAKFEGILRAHRMASDYTVRDSKRYSIVSAEWPEVKHKLNAMLRRA